MLVFALKDQDVSEYHYRFYHILATLAGDLVVRRGAVAVFQRLLREELRAGVHGEVDEESWQLKQALLRRQSNIRKETKLFRDYARQSFIDTLTLYLHGICCDIDVDTGPAPVAQPPFAQAAESAVQHVSSARRLRRVPRASGSTGSSAHINRPGFRSNKLYNWQRNGSAPGALNKHSG